MKIVCSWCQKFLGEKPPLKDKTVSHTICSECRNKLMAGEKIPEERPKKKLKAS